MSEMIDRVAKAIADNIQAGLPDGVTMDYGYAARAAIEEMREPTREMIVEGHRHDPLACDVDDDQVVYCYTIMWQAMMDAALGKTSE